MFRLVYRAIPLLLVAMFAPVMTSVEASAQPAGGREAAFIEPGRGTIGKDAPTEIVYATPANLDVGETIVGVAKRVTLFFNNSGAQDATIAQMTVSADGNVLAELIDNDCQTLGRVPAGERCSVGVQITPNSPGPWTAEIVVVHDGPGRVTRAAVLGSTAGEVGNSGQQPGLSLLGSEKAQVIDFGSVEVGNSAVRSVLLVNDSPNSLTIESMELITPGRGLALVKEGCAVGLEISAGNSCPVTVRWEPLGRGDVSTDLIIRHTGPVGFAVLPVRGLVTGALGGAASGGVSSARSADSPEAAAASLPTAPGGKVPPISAAALFAKAAGGGDAKLTLRGVVGQRALLADAGGSVMVGSVGQTIVAEGVEHRIISVEKDRVVITADGGKVELTMNMGIGSGSNSGGAGGDSAVPGLSSGASQSKSPAARIAKSGDSKAAPAITGLPAALPAGVPVAVPAAALGLPAVAP